MDLIADLDEQLVEHEEIQKFIDNLEGVDRLWRLTDLSAPNFFKLRPIDRGKISLVDILSDYIEANSDINIFEFSFCHLVRNVRKWKKDDPDHLKNLLSSNCLYLVINKIVQRVRSDDMLREKISYISITPGQEKRTLSQHWDLVYSDPKHDEDGDLIDLLMACCEFNTECLEVTHQYIDHIYDIELIIPEKSMAI